MEKSERDNRIPLEIKIQTFELIVAIVIIASIFLWCRSDAKDDYRMMQQRTEALVESIKQESKDFHGRLCAIEEKNRSK